LQNSAGARRSKSGGPTSFPPLSPFFWAKLVITIFLSRAGVCKKNKTRNDVQGTVNDATNDENEVKRRVLSHCHTQDWNQCRYREQIVNRPSLSPNPSALLCSSVKDFDYRLSVFIDETSFVTKVIHSKTFPNLKGFNFRLTARCCDTVCFFRSRCLDGLRYP